MYDLLAFVAGAELSSERVCVEQGAGVVPEVLLLLGPHTDYDRVEVSAQSLPLFTIDRRSMPLR